MQGDLDGDGDVDVDDMRLLLPRVEHEADGSNDRADLNRDGVIDVADLNLLIANFGETTPPRLPDDETPWLPIIDCEDDPFHPDCVGDGGPPDGSGTVGGGNTGGGDGSRTGTNGGGNTGGNNQLPACQLLPLGSPDELLYGQSAEIAVSEYPDLINPTITWTITEGEELLTLAEVTEDPRVFAVTAGNQTGLATIEASFQNAACQGTAVRTVTIEIDECFLWLSNVPNPGLELGQGRVITAHAIPEGGVYTWTPITFPEGVNFIPNGNKLLITGPVSADAGTVEFLVEYTVNDSIRTQLGLFEYFHSPTNDEDNDGLTDAEEIALGTDPTDPDTDGDGFPDGCEVNVEFDPLDANSPDPTSVDPGLNFGAGDCGCEAFLGSLSGDPQYTIDTDNDGLPDVVELCLGTNPNFFDSDGDGLSDGFEIEHGLNPNNPDSDGDGTADGFEDPDGDGLNNLGEQAHGSNPNSSDSDGDGVSDGQEVSQGSFPGDNSDGGEVPENVVQVTLIIGDPSGSHSERWALNVGDVRLIAPFGEVITDTFPFMEGESYEITIVHMGGEQDYDYFAAVAAAGEGVIISDPDHILGPHSDLASPPAEIATLHLSKANLTAYYTLDATSWDEITQNMGNAVPEEKEESPGVGIRLRDSSVPSGQPSENEDMVKLRIETSATNGGNPPQGVKWVIKRENERLQVWPQQNPMIGNNPWFEPGELEHEVLLLNGAGAFDVWVENLDKGASSLTFEVRDSQTDAVVASDRIVFNTFNTVVVVVTGEAGLGVPGLPEQSFFHGTTPLAQAISDEAYYVRLHREEDVAIDGSGDAYDAIKREIERHGVTEVAIIGYSHGGGSTHDLANRLVITHPPANPFSVSMSAYIDAIEQGVLDKDFGTAPETRLPPGTQFHINLWQPDPYCFVLGVLVCVHGAPVPGSAIDINVNAPPPAGWGMNHTHGTIDDEPQVHDTIVQGVLNNVTR